MHCLPSSSQVNQAQIYPRFDLLSSLWNPAWEPTAAPPLAPRGYEAASGNAVAKSQSPRKLITVFRWLVAAAILGTEGTCVYEGEMYMYAYASACVRVCVCACVRVCVCACVRVCVCA